MTTEEITTILSRRFPDSDKVVFAVTMRDVLRGIAESFGEKALSLAVPELLSAGNEVIAAFSHNLDEREIVNLGLETWKITLSL